MIDVKALRLAGFAPGLAVLATCAACTLLLDRGKVQCKTSDDCKSFGGLPKCENAICVRSGNGPPDCVSATPQSESDFRNQCSANWLPGPTADQCLTFDNCRAGLCDGGVSSTNGGLTPPPSMTPSSTPASSADAGTTVRDNLPRCNDPSADRGAVVYMTGSSNFPPLLAKLAPIVNRLTGLTPVFLTTDSCAGARSMFPQYRQTDHFIHDPAPGTTGNYAQYFDATGPHDCTLGAIPVAVDVGESEIFAETCGIADPEPSQVSHFPGPILPILFVVPSLSRTTTISAAAARQVLGNGGLLANGENIVPWDNPAFYFVRGAGTATTRLIGLAIDLPVPPYRFWGIDQGSAEKLALNLGLILDVDVAQKAIGILGADYYDQNRMRLKALAFRASDQECSYTPDSNSNIEEGRDKINVRDGHYPIWGTLHYYTAVEQSSQVSPAAAAFVNRFAVPPIAEEIVDAFIDVSWIPDCAMMVERDRELGSLRVASPRSPCNCHFAWRINLINGSQDAPPGCHGCTNDADCSTQAGKLSCVFGFCEPRPSF